VQTFIDCRDNPIRYAEIYGLPQAVSPPVLEALEEGFVRGALCSGKYKRLQTAKETASGSAGWSRPRVPPHWHKFASALAFLGKLTVKTELDHPQFK